jgi:uncharacterized membrane protein
MESKILYPSILGLVLPLLSITAINTINTSSKIFRTRVIFIAVYPCCLLLPFLDQAVLSSTPCGSACKKVLYSILLRGND